MPTESKAYDHPRTFERLTVHLPAYEVASLKMLAVGLADPGRKPNVSRTFSHVLRFYLDAKTKGKKSENPPD